MEYDKWGIVMRKFLVTFLGCVVLSYSVYGEAFKYNSGGDCVVWQRDWNPNQFWFCADKSGNVRGEKKDECNGVKVKSGSVVTKLSNNEVKRDIHRNSYSNDDYYTILCCNGKVQVKEGKKEKYGCSGDVCKTRDWFPDLTKEKDLGNGASCTQMLNRCGDVVTDCDKANGCSPVNDPDSTSSAKVTPQLREGKCVLKCSGVDRAFKDSLSSECIDCPTTRLQGIDSSGNCKYCLEGREFWVPAQGRCVTRSDMTNYSGALLEKCFMCPPNTSAIVKCMACASGAEDCQMSQDELKACNLNSQYQLIRN